MGGGRAPCCDKTKVKKGPWSPAEDVRLVAFIQKHGHGNWRTLPKQAGLLRCGKSCRLRWINYLRPDVKRGNFTPEEEASIIKLHSILGNKWAKIASHLPGRTDNEIKNVWNTHLKKRSLILANNKSSPSNDQSSSDVSSVSDDNAISGDQCLGGNDDVTNDNAISGDQCIGGNDDVTNDNVIRGDQCTGGNVDDNITSTNQGHDQQKPAILAPMDIDNDEDHLLMINGSKEPSSPVSTISSSFSSSPCNDKQESEIMPPHDDQLTINPIMIDHHDDDDVQGSVVVATTTVEAAITADNINLEEHFPPDIHDFEFWNMLESLDDGDYHDERLILHANDGDANLRLTDTIIHDEDHPLHYSQSSTNNDFIDASMPSALLFGKEEEALNETITGSVECNKWMKYLENELGLISNTATPVDQFDTDNATLDKGVIDMDEFLLPPSPNNFTVT